MALRKIFQTKSQLTAKDLRKGIRRYIFDGICSTGMGTLQGGVYLTAFALFLGASQKQIGLIASIAFLSQLMQFPGLILVNKFPGRKLITVLSASISRFFWLFIILLPVFYTMNVSLLLIILLISALIGALPGPAWNSLLRDFLPSNRLGSINSKRILTGTILAMVLTISGGYFVDWWAVAFPDHKIYAYSILFAGGLILGIIGVFVIMGIPEPVNTAARLPLRELLTTPFKDRNFKKLIFFLSMWNLAVNMSGPFFLVYMFDRIGISLFMVTVLIVVNQLSNILFLKLWGRFTDSYSNKSVLLVSGPLFILTVVAWTFTTNPEVHSFTLPMLFIIHFVNGIAVSGVTIATTNITLKLSPRAKAHSYMTAVGLSTSVVGTVAPILGGFLADIFKTIQVDIPLLITLKESSYQLSMISLKGLDFLFLITFIIGIYAMHRLAFVNEKGEVGRKKVLDELTMAIAMPLKSLSLFVDSGRIAVMPLSAMMHLAKKVIGKNNETGED